MELRQILWPIEKDLSKVKEILRTSLGDSRNPSISKICHYLLESGGKRLRPALVLLSAKASRADSIVNHGLIKLAAAIELIHISSLIHDDIIDAASLRHNRPTINAQWGQDVSIALGDYLYSIAFGLISEFGNLDVLKCISSGMRSMCEGELLQVCERDNLDLLKERYILIVKKKTAALFATSVSSVPWPRVPPLP
jgi:octaprenyl-diphosphate synthase